MTEITSTEADLQNLITTQSQQLTNANLTIIALNRVVRELENEVRQFVDLKPEKAEDRRNQKRGKANAEGR
jgi:translation initiation factor 2B subunit (eIF-2B alpha/beta/delta family)